MKPVEYCRASSPGKWTADGGASILGISHSVGFTGFPRNRVDRHWLICFEISRSSAYASRMTPGVEAAYVQG